MSSTTATTPLQDLRAWMGRHNLDAAYITKPVSIAYLTGFHAEPFERLMALAVRADRATLIVPAIEREKAVRDAEQAEVLSWRDGEDGYSLVRTALEGCPEIGVEKEHLTLQAAEMLLARTAARETQRGAQARLRCRPEIRRLRRIKNQAEIEKLARAGAITDAVGEQVISALRPGMTELEVSVMIGAAIGEHGGTLSFESLVQSGPNSALPHLRPTSRKLAEGDLVLLDFGAAFEGYRADTTRMAVIGEPTERQREIHGLVLAAHDAAIAAVRAGTTTGSVDAAARQLIEAARHGRALLPPGRSRYRPRSARGPEPRPRLCDGARGRDDLHHRAGDLHPGLGRREDRGRRGGGAGRMPPAHKVRSFAASDHPA